jgi:flagellar hook-length control protein FliK
MASIANSGSSTAAGATSLAVTGAGTQDGAAAPTDTFTQLIAEMIGAGSASPTSPSPQDLAALGMGGEPLEPSDDRESDTDDADEEEASSIDALLSGFPAVLAPIPPPASHRTPSGTVSNGAGTVAKAIDDSLSAKHEDADVLQALIQDLDGDTTESDASLTEAITPTIVPSSQNANAASHAHVMLPTHAVPDLDVAPDATLRAPVGTPAWKDELGTQITWMAANGREAASLRLSPEHLGPLEVRISMREGEASVYFGASNPDTRSALEQSLPRLRELFAAQGLVLADAGVSRDPPRNAFKPATQPDTPRSVSDAAGEATVTSITLARSGLIDTYV